MSSSPPCELLVRPLRPEDRAGLLSCLNHLSPTPEMDEWAFGLVHRIRLDRRWLTFVALRDGRVVGAAGGHVETKFSRGGGKVGHVEDVVVLPEERGRGTGRALLAALTGWFREQGCHKAVLSCSEKNVWFYAACGYRRHEVGMRLDLN